MPSKSHVAPLRAPLELGLFVFRNKNLVPHAVKRYGDSMQPGCDPLVKASPRQCLYVQGLSVRSVTNPARTLFDSAVNLKTPPTTSHTDTGVVVQEKL